MYRYSGYNGVLAKENKTYQGLKKFLKWFNEHKDNSDQYFVKTIPFGLRALTFCKISNHMDLLAEFLELDQKYPDLEHQMHKLKSDGNAFAHPRKHEIDESALRDWYSQRDAFPPCAEVWLALCARAN